MNLQEKILEQAKSGNWSPQMVALLGYVMCQTWTEPCILDLNRTSDNYAVTFNSDGSRNWLGSWSMVEENLKKVAEAADLTGEERSEFVALCSIKHIYLWGVHEAAGKR